MILTQSHSICIYTVKMKHFRSNEAPSAARKSSLIEEKKNSNEICTEFKTESRQKNTSPFQQT